MDHLRPVVASTSCEMLRQLAKKMARTEEKKAAEQKLQHGRPIVNIVRDEDDEGLLQRLLHRLHELDETIEPPIRFR